MHPSLRLLSHSAPPVIRLANATLTRNSSKALWSNLNFILPSTEKQAWAVLGGWSEERTALLHALRGDFQASPPGSRSYPLLSTPEIAKKDPRLRSPIHAIQYVGFDAERGTSNLRGAYLSARYESRRETTDFTVRNYLLGYTELNAADNLLYHPEEGLFQRIANDLNLEKLLDLPVSNLSNGQTRRAKIAKALLESPEVLLLDSPFSESNWTLILILAD
jgi:ABC transporter